jgi:hypothetical protein
MSVLVKTPSMGRDVIPKSVAIGSPIENSITSPGQNHRTRDNDLSALRVPPPLLMSMNLIPGVGPIRTSQQIHLSAAVISALHRPYCTGRTAQAEGCPGLFGRPEVSAFRIKKEGHWGGKGIEFDC